VREITKPTGGPDNDNTLMFTGRDIPWLLRRQAERHPDKDFIVWEPFSGAPATWTYHQFRADVRSLAGALHTNGVVTGDAVIIHLDNSPEFLITWFACSELGAIAVSTNTRSVGRDVTYFANHVAAKIAVTSPGFAKLLHDNAPGLDTLIVTATDAGEPAEIPPGLAYTPFADLLTAADDYPSRPADPMADLGIQFTSGTTSRPKAVLWTHANALWGAEVNVAHMRLRDDDTTLVFLPLFHTNAQSYSMLSTLWVGGTMVLQPRFSASRFWDVSQRNNVSWTSMVPFCVRALGQQAVPEVHTYRFWAPAIQLPDIEKLFGVQTMAWWGMTETITHGIVGSFDQPGPNRSIGRPSPAYDISIRRPDGSAIEPGERGALFVRGVPGISLFKEYYGDPEATAAAFDDGGWLDTGDLIFMDEHGNLFFSDRDKDMLKVGGENVAASEIEAVILETGLVAECAVVGQAHYMLDEVPVAFVIPRPKPADDLSDRLIATCSKNLPDFKVPRSIHIVDDLPRSTLEKVAKNELRSRLPEIER